MFVQVSCWLVACKTSEITTDSATAVAGESRAYVDLHSGESLDVVRRCMVEVFTSFPLFLHIDSGADFIGTGSLADRVTTLAVSLSSAKDSHTI